VVVSLNNSPPIAITLNKRTIASVEAIWK